MRWEVLYDFFFVSLILSLCAYVGGKVDESELPSEASRGHQASGDCELGLPGLGARN